MFSTEQQEKFEAINGDMDLVPYRLQDHSVALIAMVLENGRGQRFLAAPPAQPAQSTHEEFVNTVKELRWEGFVDIPKDDVDGDGILDDVLETGWKTTDSGLEFLRRLKDAAGI